MVPRGLLTSIPLLKISETEGIVQSNLFAANLKCLKIANDTKLAADGTEGK